jgi:hypothetical protein
MQVPNASLTPGVLDLAPLAVQSQWRGRAELCGAAGQKNRPAMPQRGQVQRCMLAEAGGAGESALAHGMRAS